MFVLIQCTGKQLVSNVTNGQEQNEFGMMHSREISTLAESGVIKRT